MTDAILPSGNVLDAVVGERDGDYSDDIVEEPESYRPALIKLTNDIEALQRELELGFDSRRRVLEWLQRLAIRTLGELPQRVFWELARQFVLDVRDDQRQGVLLAALLTPAVRERSLPEDTVTELRGRFIATQLRPAYHRAFRELRKDATEYIDDADVDEDAHAPARQRHPAMRPGLAELEQWQQTALAQLLAGFDDTQDILSWGRYVELATWGEVDEIEPPEWIRAARSRTSGTDRDLVERCVTERFTRALLLSDDGESARELFAAVHLLPAMNRGVRVLAGRAGEVADAKRKRQTPTQL
ncbi:hypothetical protein [Haladaptatus sp. DYF46]|uniref:hypothetical protein n=1 Tax=Haladaptatus sp. DYF46 TaxID=2886041 RepID=UPI001E4885FC|nr:hypothetical protein [Haladaptatus sp. DYF46]